MKRLLPLALGLAAAGGAAAAERTLTVYTYDSFVSEWGPGPAIEAAFEARCGDCDLRFVALDGGVDILQRLRLEGEGTGADLVLGLDMNLMAEARALDLLAPHGVDTGALELPIEWDDDTFLPFDWGHFAFVYDREQLAEPPGSFEALAAAPEDLQIAIQDPRSSTPGLGLVMWVRHVYGDDAPDYWRRLKPHVLTVTKGWSESYSLFLDGEADMVLSYTTSPAYHMVAEDRHDIRAAAFEEGHYLQMELAAVTAASDQKDLARRFIDYLIGPEAQAAIPTNNWMFPVNPEVELPDAFGTLVRPERTLAFSAEKAAANRKAWIDEWLAVMGE